MILLMLFRHYSVDFVSWVSQLHPVTWVDDVAIPVLVVDGGSLNFKSKKTEAVIDLRGENAPHLRHSLFVERLGHLVIPGLPNALRGVAQYEHLGTCFSADGNLKPEIKHRCLRALQVQVSNSILRNRHIPISVRLPLFESLVIPVLMHGAGNWVILSTRLFN